MEVTGVEIVIGIALAVCGPALTGYFGTRSGLNGMRKDMIKATGDIAEIKKIQTIQVTELALAKERASEGYELAVEMHEIIIKQGVKMALNQQQLENVIRHCEWMHKMPIPERPPSER